MILHGFVYATDKRLRTVLTNKLKQYHMKVVFIE